MATKYYDEFLNISNKYNSYFYYNSFYINLDGNYIKFRKQLEESPHKLSISKSPSYVLEKNVYSYIKLLSDKLKKYHKNEYSVMSIYNYWIYLYIEIYRQTILSSKNNNSQENYNKVENYEPETTHSIRDCILSIEKSLELFRKNALLPEDCLSSIKGDIKYLTNPFIQFTEEDKEGKKDEEGKMIKVSNIQIYKAVRDKIDTLIKDIKTAYGDKPYRINENLFFKNIIREAFLYVVLHTGIQYLDFTLTKKSFNKMRNLCNINLVFRNCKSEENLDFEKSDALIKAMQTIEEFFISSHLLIVQLRDFRIRDWIIESNAKIPVSNPLHSQYDFSSEEIFLVGKEYNLMYPFNTMLENKLSEYRRTSSWNAHNICNTTNDTFSIDKMNDETTDKITDKTIDKMIDKITNKITDKIIDKMIDKITDKVADKINNKMTDDTSLTYNMIDDDGLPPIPLDLEEYELLSEESEIPDVNIPFLFKLDDSTHEALDFEPSEALPVSLDFDDDDIPKPDIPPIKA